MRLRTHTKKKKLNLVKGIENTHKLTSAHRVRLPSILFNTYSHTWRVTFGHICKTNFPYLQSTSTSLRSRGVEIRLEVFVIAFQNEVEELLLSSRKHHFFFWLPTNSL